MKMYGTLVLIVLMTVVCILMGAAALASGEAPQGPTVMTRNGLVQGVEKDGIHAFLGVPYAQVPEGSLRFAPPVEATPWEGVLDCTQTGDSALQVPKEDADLTYSEDCLNLNIWTPVDAEGKKLPVLVFIHGGAFAQGSPSLGHYDGTRFAQDGIIQVNIAYRLNALGFMAFPEIVEAYGFAGNMGLLDQIMALTWVRDNIAAFGGDPENITISGESAGSYSVSNLLLSPLAEGLFQKAIMESGNILGQPIVAPQASGDVAQALDNSLQFQASLGADGLAEMQALDGMDIALGSAFSIDVTNPSEHNFWPVFDGKALPSNPYEALLNGAYNGVDLLLGYNADEGSMFVPEGTTEAAYETLVRSVFGEMDAEAVLARFPVDSTHTATDRARELFLMGIRMGSDVFADVYAEDGHKVYAYNLARRFPALDAAGLGTMHALELFFVFDSVPEGIPLSDEVIAFKEDLHNRWLNFVCNGDPNEGVDVEAQWPLYTKEARQVLVLDEDPHAAPASQQDDIAFYMDLLWKTGAEGLDALAAEAYVYGYPLVFCVDQMERIVTEGIGAMPQAPLNAFGHGQALANADADFVAINNDTLYSNAVLDMSGGPLVLRVPDTDDRYYVMQFVDAWTNNFAYIGRRATGTEAATYFLTPSDWTGDIPEGMTEIRVPTQLAVIVGRWAVEGQDDLENVYALQQATSLTPYEEGRVLKGFPAYDASVEAPYLFYERLRAYLQAFPAAERYDATVQRFAPLGLLNADAAPYAMPSSALANALAEGARQGLAAIEGEVIREEMTGWQLELHSFDYNMDFFELGTLSTPEWIMDDLEAAIGTRAGAAHAGLWGNHGYEAGYASLWTDAQGDALNGAHRYQLTLAPPPVDAFWSITMYDLPYYYLVDNEIDRYSIGDRTPGIVYNEDGMITIHMSAAIPEDEAAQANWLPAPEGDFRLILRMYQPGEEILAGTYTLPDVERID